MINFKNLSQEVPYKIFKEKYDEATNGGQIKIEAICISTYDKINNQVDSRYVNLKFINNNEFIFFTNYESVKAKAFLYHQQISALFYWPSIDVQIRMKANINKTSSSFNKEYFKTREKNKNALAISSNQSKKISSYDEVLKKFNHVKSCEDLTICPESWGGYSFIPFYFEFWEGNNSRINKREVYEKFEGNWQNYTLQP